MASKTAASEGLMKGPHVAIIVDPCHGHIYPTLGILAELVARGCRVSCAASRYFAEKIAKSGGEPIVYTPLEPMTCSKRFVQAGGGDRAAFMRFWKEYEQEEVENALPQLEELYKNKRPDLILYDLRTLYAQVLASEWNIAKIEHSPQFIRRGGYSWVGRPYDETLVLVSVPKLLHPYVDELDHRFHFVGPIYSDRKFFEPWTPQPEDRPRILVSATTALVQPDFFKLMVDAFRDLPLRIFLSIGDALDPESLGPLPSNFELNRSSSHLEILKHVSLFVCQGGLGSSLEALYRGVPVLAIPPSEFHEEVAVRIAELGLGIRLEPPGTIEAIRDSASFLMQSAETRQRVREVQRLLRQANDGKLAGDLIMSRLNGG
jgi:UDP:flavonoid glycosyltransferase YjiC (YdhE family)